MARLVLAVCSSDPLMLPGVTHLLANQSAFEVVPVHRVVEADLAVVIADRMDPAAVALLTMAATSSSAGVLVVTDDLDGTDLATLARCRVTGLLSRSAVTAATLTEAISTAAASSTPLESLAARVPRPTDAEVLAPRERDLVRLLADGCDTAEIAARLSYSERTVKNIVHGLLNRLQLRNRAHAVAYAMRAGAL